MSDNTGRPKTNEPKNQIPVNQTTRFCSMKSLEGSFSSLSNVFMISVRQNLTLTSFCILSTLIGDSNTHLISKKLLTQTKVCQHHMAIRIKENILEFYIPIYNPQLQTECKKKYFQIRATTSRTHY